jgi:amino acid transporter
MAFNVGCAMLVALFGSPVRIYIFSNVGYLVAVIPALVGYFVLRQMQPERISPFRLPAFSRWVALGAAIFLTVVFVIGGWNSPGVVVGPGTSHFLFILGLAIVAVYAPLNLWRRVSDSRRTPVLIPQGASLSPVKQTAAREPGLAEALDTE